MRRGAEAINDPMRVGPVCGAAKTLGVSLADIDSHHIDAQLRSLLCDVLGLEETQVADFTAKTELFGALPELDSMAVAGLLTEMEDRLHITIDDDEVDGELFETYGNLLTFAEGKVGA